MKVGVAGLWHLGTVTAACVASSGRDVVAFDAASPAIDRLASGHAPVFEPGLDELIARGLADGRLRVSSRTSDLAECDVIWIAYDTPVDEAGRGDVDAVMRAAAAILPAARDGCLVLVSSQLPVGSVRRLESTYQGVRPGGTATFACSPENLRLGRALDAFMRPDRVVAGVRQERDRVRIARLFEPFSERIEWMSVESAEMTKHALNAFLATCVTFTNELAVLCERVGADARDVERGLKSDARIGSRAYLRPGGAFAGGTLARDVAFLLELGQSERLPAHLMSAVQVSNEAHRAWPRRRLVEIIGDVVGKSIALLGLTYKAGTDTLRGSTAIEIARWLAERGARVGAYDPAVRTLPGEYAKFVTLRASAEDVLRDADAVVVGTDWPEFAAISADELVRAMRSPLVVDPSGFLHAGLGTDARIRYYSVGRAA
ncbi:MAG TPA: nucleotide sugar dehydrogenase [Candidatus Acidoferrum sp.]|nr:nucleotide sugar dehydrogenase [Candidatus Acidoferrum sp.]